MLEPLQLSLAQSKLKAKKIASWHQFLVDLWVARVLQNRSEDALLPKTRTDNGQAGG